MSPHRDDLAGFGLAAQRAVARAEDEARQFGHHRIGTEHLLLGLLADDDTRSADADTAAAVLRGAGLRFAATRHKAREAAGGWADSDEARAPGAGPLPRTARAERAITRSVRFSHVHGSNVAGSEHLLLGVLDVEGTAGQVLRGLGVEVDQVRTALEAAMSFATEAPAVETGPSDQASAPAAASTTRCPSCGTPLEHQIGYQTVLAGGEHGARMVTVFSCRACQTFLGLDPD